MAKTGPKSSYKPEYATKKVDEYLKERQDETEKIVVQENTEKGYNMSRQKLTVKLPTIEGYAVFLGVSKPTLYTWAKEHPAFEYALDRIKHEQLQRLIDMGLSGDYNSTIAKLMLSHNHGMREGIDATSGGEPINTFNDEQIKRIAERVTGRPGKDGDTPVKKLTD